MSPASSRGRSCSSLPRPKRLCFSMLALRIDFEKNEIFCSNSKHHEPNNKEEGKLSNVSQFDRCASRGFAEHIEPQGAPAAHDAGRHLHFVELRQPRTEKS